MVRCRALGLFLTLVVAGFSTGCGNADKSWESSKDAPPDQRPDYSKYSQNSRYGPGQEKKDGAGAHSASGSGGGGGSRAAHGR
jgi:hypothetical protein